MKKMTQDHFQTVVQDAVEVAMNERWRDRAREIGLRGALEDSGAAGGGGGGEDGERLAARMAVAAAIGRLEADGYLEVEPVKSRTRE